MIIINEWVEGYYTYGRLNSQGFCSLEDLEHSLDRVQWDKDKAIDYVMWNHNIEKDQATGMIEWAMSLLTMPGFVASVKTPKFSFPDCMGLVRNDINFEAINKDGNIVAMTATVASMDVVDIEKAKLDLKANAESAEISESVYTIPYGWLVCDGAVLDIDSTPELFAAIGRKFNTGGELTGQFRLPDFRIGPASTTPANHVIKYSNDKHGNAGDITEMTTGKDGA